MLWCLQSMVLMLCIYLSICLSLFHSVSAFLRINMFINGYLLEVSVNVWALWYCLRLKVRIVDWRKVNKVIIINVPIIIYAVYFSVYSVLLHCTRSA